MNRMLMMSFAVLSAASVAQAGQFSVSSTVTKTSVAEYVALEISVVSKCYTDATAAVSKTAEVASAIESVVKEFVRDTDKVKEAFTNEELGFELTPGEERTMNGERVVLCPNRFEAARLISAKLSETEDLPALMNGVLKVLKENPLPKDLQANEPYTAVRVESPRPSICSESRAKLASEAQAAAFEKVKAEAALRAQQCGGIATLKPVGITVQTDEDNYPRKYNQYADRAMSAPGSAGGEPSAGQNTFRLVKIPVTVTINYEFEGNSDACVIKK